MVNSASKSVAVSLQGICKSFGDSSVLDDISFDVLDGEILVLLGASGSGKTTILRVMSGLEMPDRGSVRFHGKDVTTTPARGRGTGIIFQSYALFPKMTVEKNISYGLRLRRKSKSEIRNRVDELIDLVRLGEHRDKYPSQLSGGQQQRVAIARALAYWPAVLLFDEPFGALDAQIRTRLRREIRHLLKSINVPSVFITHDQEEALELGDRIAVLNNGRIEQIGSPYEVYMHPETEFVATFLGAANLLPGVVRSEKFECSSVSITLDDPGTFRDGQPVKLVFRPEDVFLRRPENLVQNYQYLAEGTVEEVSFVGAFERIVLTLDVDDRPQIIVTRPKTETSAFPLSSGISVSSGIVRFCILPDHSRVKMQPGIKNIGGSNL